VPELDDHPSLAALLDEVRPLIVEARRGGANPRYLMLPREQYDAVEAVKAGDRERGMPMIVLGMEVVRADDAAAPPRVF
jgi:hypothetical protein